MFLILYFYMYSNKLNWLYIEREVSKQQKKISDHNNYNIPIVRFNMPKTPNKYGTIFEEYLISDFRNI